MGGYDPEFEMVWKALREQAKDLVAKAAETLREAKFNVSTELVEGDPKSQIIDAAKNWHADPLLPGLICPERKQNSWCRIIIMSSRQSCWGIRKRGRSHTHGRPRKPIGCDGVTVALRNVRRLFRLVGQTSSESLVERD